MAHMMDSSRRGFLKHCAATTTGAMLAGQASGAPEDRERQRPNILLVLTDNQSWGHCGAMGDPIVKTPAFDWVARQGVLCRQTYAPSPSCTPSRSAILTGQDMWRLEEAGLLYGGLPTKFPLYPHLLEDRGYHVGHTGKGWGPGQLKDYGHTRNPVGKAYNEFKTDEDEPGTFHIDYGANFRQFLAARKENQPFCFWFGAREPHRPFVEGLGRRQGWNPGDVPLPAFLPGTDVIRNDFLDYYTEIERLDRHLQTMLDHLAEIGELDNTLIVVTSDNGIQMPRGIVTLYDYGVRVPMAACWGERIPKGQETGAFINLIDLAPTFLEAAGVPAPKGMTGRSLIPLWCEGEDASSRDCVFTGVERHTLCRPGELPYPSRAIRTKDYLYIRNFEPGRWPVGAPDYQAPAQGYYGDVDESPTKKWMMAHAKDPGVREQFELCFGKRPGEELYYVPNDPDQIRNLAQDPAHEEARLALASRLEAHLKQTQDPRAEGRSPWDAYPYHSKLAYEFREQFTNPHVMPDE